MKKRIPYSVSDYRKIVSGEFYYVDKTRYISELEQWEVPLFLRPKRFGKSLWCSTLAYYYDINYKDDFEQLFGNTAVGKHPTAEHNTYAVMQFSFAGIVTQGGIDEIRDNFNDCCHDVFLKFISRYPSLGLTADAVPRDAISALRDIFRAVQLKGLPPVYVIIDEYDNFTNSLLTSHGLDEYHSVTTGDSFLRTFYKVVKEAVGNGMVGRVFMTGVLPVTLDDMTSGFNIAKNVSFLPTLEGMIGFTQRDVTGLVDEIFQDYNLSSDLKRIVLEELKNNYDGYSMIPLTAEKLYNSTICNNYLSELTVERSIPRKSVDVNLTIDRNWFRLMMQSNDQVPDLMCAILGSGTVSFSEDHLSQCFNAMSFQDRNALLLLFFHLGLLTWDDEDTLRIPNQNQLVLFGQYCRELQGWSVPDDSISTAVRQFKTTLN